MEERVKIVLRAAFPGIEIDTETTQDGRVIGSVSWEGFAGVDHVDRQNKIRTLLRQELGADARQVGVLLTYTPDELKAMRAA